MPGCRPSELPIAGDSAGLGHPGQAEIGGVGQHCGEHNASIIGRRTRMQVREGAAETGPAIHLGEQAGDAKVRHHPIQPVGQGLRLLRCRRLERRDFQLITFDSDVFEPVCRGFGRHLGEAPFQQSATLGKVLFGGCRRRDGERSGLAHRGEQGGRNTELAGNKTKRQLRDQFARPQEPPRIAQRAKLQSETQPIAIAPAPVNCLEIGAAQGPVPDQGVLLGR